MKTPTKTLCSLALLLLAFTLVSACGGGSGACSNDQDCSPGFACNMGICEPMSSDGGWDADAGIDAGGDDGATGGDDGATGGDDGGTGGDDGGTGGDDGATVVDEDPGLLIQPGTGIGSMQVTTNPSVPVTLSQIRNIVGEQGMNTSGDYTLSFLSDTLWVSGLESDPEGYQVFDNPDMVITLTARTGMNAHTADGLGPGSTLAEVRAVPAWSNPDRTAIIPAGNGYAGGKMDEFFSRGLFIGYNESDVATSFAVTRTYLPPNGTITPTTATLRIGTTNILAGDGSDTGSPRYVHVGVLGTPDRHITYDQVVGGYDVTFYVDTYRVMGMEFIGVEEVSGLFDIDKLVAVVMYPLFYGSTSAGHRLGSTRSEWQSELGSSPEIKQDATSGSTMYIYTVASHKFGIVYANDGANMSDKAVMLMLNYQEAE
ncbi:MAG: hypothetical protein JRF33_14060 [Deltaproteobacteria bacterium]|nr:hypothetical protein [Deltaproteobacteria bacterium]